MYKTSIMSLMNPTNKEPYRSPQCEAVERDVESAVMTLSGGEYSGWGEQNI